MVKTMLKQTHTYTILIFILASAAPNLFAQLKSLQPVPLIFDTDLGNDCDDVLAMGVIHALQTRGECRLLAVTITKDHELAAPFADAVNTFYNRGEIPVGVCRSGVTPDEGKFNGLAAKADDGKDRFPHDLRSGQDAPDAVEVLRQSLASQKDGSVVIAQVGFSTNLANPIAIPGRSAFTAQRNGPGQTKSSPAIHHGRGISSNHQRQRAVLQSQRIQHRERHPGGEDVGDGLAHSDRLERL